MNAIFRAIFSAVLGTALIWQPLLAAGATVSLGTGALEVAVGQTAPFVVRASDIQGLYGFELQLTFDPAVVEVVDADASSPGVQIGPGDFLSPDFVVQNRADNQAGTVEFVVTQLNPSPAKSGSGALLTVPFRGLASGRTSQIAAAKSKMADRNGVLIPATVVPGTVRVVGAGSPGGSTATLTPTGVVSGVTATRTATPPATSAAAPTHTPLVLAALPSATARAAAAASPTPLPAVTPGPTATRPAAAATGTATALKRAPETASPAPPGQSDQGQAAEKTPTPASTPGAVPSALTSTKAVTPSSAGTPQPTILVPTATATPMVLARAPAGAPGKPILSGNAASGTDADSARTARSDTPDNAMLTAAGVALGIALLCLAVAGVLFWRRRRA